MKQITIEISDDCGEQLKSLYGTKTIEEAILLVIGDAVINW